MVGLPNRAARCGICQRHKIKCDLLRPACSRCKRLNLSCEYPDLQRGQIFVNRNLKNPRVKAIDILSTTTSEKKKLKTPENIYPISVVTNLGGYPEQQNVSIPPSPNPETLNRIQLLSTFIDLYLPKTQGAAVPGQSPATWINCLGNIATSNNTFDISLKALCLTQLGLWHHDSALVKESHRLYGSALRGLREEVSHRTLDAPKATLATIIILSTYELFSGSSERSQGWVSHARGGSHILRVLDPSIASSPVGRLLCPRIRIIGIFESFRSRKTALLTGLHLQSPTEAEISDLYCHLQDLMIQIPPILEIFDTLTITTIDQATLRTVLVQLLQRCTTLHAQFLAWCEVLRERVPSQLYSSHPSIAHNPADEPGSHTFPLAFRFLTLSIAQLFLLYWSNLIVLYRTIQDISLRLAQPLPFPSPGKSSLSSPSDQECSCDDDFEFEHSSSFPSTNNIAALARKICQSFEYCYQSTNGTLGIQSTVFPRWVATEFYASRPKYHRELKWCDEVQNMTADGVRFDLRVAKFGDMGEFRI